MVNLGPPVARQDLLGDKILQKKDLAPKDFAKELGEKGKPKELDVKQVGVKAEAREPNKNLKEVKDLKLKNVTFENDEQIENHILINEDKLPEITISHSAKTSDTFCPVIYCPEGENFSYIDNPGFKDTSLISL